MPGEIHLVAPASHLSYLNRQAFGFPEAGRETGITQAQVAAVFQDGQLKPAQIGGRQTLARPHGA